MLKPSIVIISILLLAACSTTAPPSATPDIDAIVDATVQAEREALFMPELVAPVDGAVFTNPADVVLAWNRISSLEAGQFYDVRVWREGEPDFGIAWTTDQTYDLANYLTQQNSGEFLWTIAVVEGDADTREVTGNIGDVPAARRFTVESNILPTPTVAPTEAPPGLDTIIAREIPAGFTLEIVAHIDEAPTAVTDIEFTEDGRLLALTIDGRLYETIDDDGDGIYEDYRQIISDDLSFAWSIGIASYEDRIYISDEQRVGFIEDADGDGIFDTYTLLTDDLPGRAYPLHSNNGILIYDDLLYIAVGSTTDHGPLQHEHEAAILTMELDGGNLEVFASGFRNPYDLAMSPDGRLFTGDNSPDRYDSQLTFLPPEELNYVREGRNYGFPDVYGAGKSIRDFDYETEDPVVELITSTVTVGVAYYAGDNFPEYYQDGVFVAQFGGMTPARNVLFVPLEETDDGNYTGEYEPFINFTSGWEPTSLAIGSDGALYIVEWTEGYILRASYSVED